MPKVHDLDTKECVCQYLSIPRALMSVPPCTAVILLVDRLEEYFAQDAVTLNGT